MSQNTVPASTNTTRGDPAARSIQRYLLPAASRTGMTISAAPISPAVMPPASSMPANADSTGEETRQVTYS